MVRAVGERHADVHHGIAGEHTGCHGFLHTMVHGGDVLVRDTTAGDLVDELVTPAGAGGLEVQYDVRVLTLTTGLLHVARLGLLDRTCVIVSR